MLKIVRPLPLAVKRNAWRAAGQFESKHAAWGPRRKQILERDDYACQFCYFTPLVDHSPAGTGGYQEVHHINGDHDDDSDENLITTCPLCHATQHLGLAGQMGRIKLIWMPDIPQQVINLMGMYTQLGPYSPNADAAFLKNPLEDFKAFIDHRCDIVTSIVGTNDIIELSNNLLGLTDTQYESVQQDLKDLRVWPLMSGYTQEQRDVWLATISSLVPTPNKVTAYLMAGEETK